MIPTLHFFYQKGCSHCVAGEEFVRPFAAKRISKLIVIYHRIDLLDYPIQGWSPNATPGYALVVSGTLLGTHEGVLDEAGLARFVDGRKKGKKPRKSRSKVGGKQAIGEEPEEDEDDEDAEDDEEDDDEEDE